MVESSQDLYKFQFIKFDVGHGHAEYLVKVIAPGGITFHIKDRYSSMRRFQSAVKKQFSLKEFTAFPNFPPKKMFSNTSNEFLTQRMNQLQNFFNNFFQNQDILKFQGLVIYFQEKAADQQSKGKIQELIDYLERKINQKNSRPTNQNNADNQQNRNQNAGQNQQAQDGPNKEMNQNLIVQTNQNFDWKAFEQECRKIVNEISDKFIDLGLDEQHSEYGQDLIHKQEKFKKELDKREKDFKFDAETLQLPQSTISYEDLLEDDDVQLSRQNQVLGQDLNDIFDIIHERVKKHYMQEGQIIQYN